LDHCRFVAFNNWIWRIQNLEKMNNYNPWQPVPAAQKGFDQGSVTNTAKDIATVTAANIPTNATGARIQFQADSGASFTDSNVIVRFTPDGTTPTTSIGFFLGSGDWYEVKTAEELKLIQFISAEGTNQVNINVQYYYNTMLP
jgi:hypothetical protein